MSHKVLTNNGVALCQLKTYYKNQDMRQFCLGSRDGRFLAFVSTHARLLPQEGSTYAVTQRPKSWIKLCHIEIANIDSVYGIRVMNSVLSDPMFDVRARSGVLRSELGHFIWAVRSYVSREINPKRCWYDFISYTDFSMFLTQLHLFDEDISLVDGDLAVTPGHKYLQRSVRKWRRGQTQKHRIG